MIATLEALSGVSVVSATSDGLELQLTTRVTSHEPSASGWDFCSQAEGVFDVNLDNQSCTCRNALL